MIVNQQSMYSVILMALKICCAFNLYFFFMSDQFCALVVNDRKIEEALGQRK